MRERTRVRPGIDPGDEGHRPFAGRHCESPEGIEGAEAEVGGPTTVGRAGEEASASAERFPNRPKCFPGRRRPLGVFPETIETDRLRLERLTDGVTPRELYDAAGRGRSPTIEREAAYLPWEPLGTLRDAEERLDSFAAEWAERERAEWAIRPREGEAGAGAFAGSAGVIPEWEKDCALLAVWLREPFWGRRYSGERADALLDVAFDRLDVGVVAVPLHADNRRSYRAVERYVTRHGGRYEGRLRNHAGRYDDPADHHRFSVSRGEWADADGARTDVRYRRTEASRD